jgi:hypothetical protein
MRESNSSASYFVFERINLKMQSSLEKPECVMFVNTILRFIEICVCVAKEMQMAINIALVMTEYRSGIVNKLGLELGGYS